MGFICFIRIFLGAWSSGSRGTTLSEAAAAAVAAAAVAAARIIHLQHTHLTEKHHHRCFPGAPKGGKRRPPAQTPIPSPRNASSRRNRCLHRATTTGSSHTGPGPVTFPHRARPRHLPTPGPAPAPSPAPRPPAKEGEAEARPGAHTMSAACSQAWREKREPRSGLPRRRRSVPEPLSPPRPPPPRFLPRQPGAAAPSRAGEPPGPFPASSLGKGSSRGGDLIPCQPPPPWQRGGGEDGGGGAFLPPAAPTRPLRVPPSGGGRRAKAPSGPPGCDLRTPCWT